MAPSSRFKRFRGKSNMKDFSLGAILMAVSILILVLLPFIVYEETIKPNQYRVEMDGEIYNVDDIVKDALNESSPYEGKFVGGGGIDDMKYYPTLDCPVMISLANGLNKIIKDWSDLDKANFILKFVQQNTEYVLDQDRFGSFYRDVWVFPVDTLSQRVGDCEDTSFLCASLMALVGLDVVTVSLPGHMAVGVYVGDVELSGNRYIIDGKVYYHAETTSDKAIGECDTEFGTSDFQFHPSMPNSDFLSRLRDTKP